MATTAMLTGNALTLKKWAKLDYLDMYKSFCFGRMMSRGVGFYPPELNGAQTGDQVTFAFTSRLTGGAIGEGGTVDGNEESLALSSAAMTINVIRKGVLNPNDETIEQKRTLIPFESRAREELPGFFGAHIDTGIFYQLGGANPTSISFDGITYTSTDRQFAQGMNSIVAPSTNRILRAAGRANDESITSSDTLSLDLISAALESIQRTYPTAKPLKGDEWDLYVSWEQLTDLERDTTGKLQFTQLAIAAMQGGQIDKNPLMQGQFLAQPVARFKNVNIIPTHRIAVGVNSSTSAAITTVRRAVLCGQNAFSFGSLLGGRLTDTSVPLIYKTMLKDYEYYKGIEGRMIYGIKKLALGGEDYGSFVLSTYAGTHSS